MTRALALLIVLALLTACARGTPPPAPPDLPSQGGRGLSLSGGSAPTAPAVAVDVARPCVLSARGGTAGMGGAVTVAPGSQVAVEVRCAEPALVQGFLAVPGGGVVAPVEFVPTTEDGTAWTWALEVPADAPAGAAVLVHVFASGEYSGAVELVVR